MQRENRNNPKSVGQRKNNFFQKPKNTPHSFKPEPKSTRASEETGNEFFLKPTPKQKLKAEDPPNATKKPFDKKSWRLQKYSKKYKLDQWENRRKNTVLREYYKQIDPNEKKLDVQKIYEQYDDEITAEENDNDNNANADNTPTVNEEFNKPNDNDESAVGYNKKNKTKNAFQKAREQMARMKEQKQLKKNEFLQKKQEKEEKLKLYKLQKIEKFKKLNKKTKRGQPIMKDRMEMLLIQIQKNM